MMSGEGRRDGWVDDARMNGQGRQRMMEETDGDQGGIHFDTGLAILHGFGPW